jgi:hypothetical protein
VLASIAISVILALNMYLHLLKSFYEYRLEQLQTENPLPGLQDATLGALSGDDSNALGCDADTDSNMAIQIRRGMGLI